ncbi:MAG: hypothetical protein KGI38_11535 [Thaumarchaeota archaeon]|nr:hypothetical protein [Nitrososphaerota archaeon]
MVSETNGGSPLDCVVCGLSLGSGVPGGQKYCQRCESYVTTKARVGSGAVVGGLILLGVGVVVGVATISVLKRVFGGDR